jgi:hypothetical protein
MGSSTRPFSSMITSAGSRIMRASLARTKERSSAMRASLLVAGGIPLIPDRLSVGVSRVNAC